MASESAWLLQQIDAFTEAEQAGDHARARDLFLKVTNRCAQLSLWADLYTPDHVNVPADDDPQWVTMARAGHSA